MAKKTHIPNAGRGSVTTYCGLGIDPGTMLPLPEPSSARSAQ